MPVRLQARGSTAIFRAEKEKVSFMAYELPVIESPVRDEKDRYGANVGRGLHGFQ